jgi:hypothetical protein
MTAHAALPELGFGILGAQPLDRKKDQGREQSQSWRGPVQHNTSWTEHPARGADKLRSKVLKCFESMQPLPGFTQEGKYRIHGF